MGSGSEWEAKGWVYHTLEQKSSYKSTERVTVSLSGQDDCWQQFDTKCTCSLISVPQWHCICHSGLSVALSLVCLDNVRVWLSCQAKKWISVLALLCLVFTIQVAYAS